MRSTLFAVLASASIVSAARCAQNNIADLVAETSCGSIEAISQCLESADFLRLDEIERCYSANGCSAGAATVEAVWFSKNCQPLLLEEGRHDLKKRADFPAGTEAKATNAKRVAVIAGPTIISSPPAITARADATTPTTPLICSVTSQFQTTVCATTSGKSTCSETTTSTASCAPGLICFLPSSTSDPALCMKRDDHLTTSGLIVTIIFAAALVATIITFIVSGMRNSKKVKQQEYAQQMAAASSKGNDVEASSFTKTTTNRPEANVPLMTPGGVRSEDYGGQQSYFDGGNGGGGDSVTPPAGRAPGIQLHQGLGALGQERF